jgi:hypothetical protein
MPRRRFTIADLLTYLAGVFGLSFAVAGIWLGMRAVMDIGGTCASGGPYVIETTCPDGVDLLLFLAFPLGFASAGLMVWKGARLGAAYAGLVALAWPALFLGLGWNFLEYAVRNPFGEGVELGWLIPGVIFVVMGGLPLAAWVGARGHGPVVPGVRATTTPIELRELAGAMRQVTLRAGTRDAATTTVADAMDDADRREASQREATRRSASAGPEPDGLVDQLERLARLHESGALGEQEYADAKLAVIGAASRGELP